MSVAKLTIELSGLTKKFGKRTVLDGVNLKLYAGTCSLLCGKNGTGKTTLLRILAGLDKPNDGLLNLGDGNKPWKKSKKQLLDTTVYLHQEPYMFEGSVMDNLAYALPRRTKHRGDIIHQTLEWASLETLASSRAKTLSGGEKQRVALARAWLRNPAVMLLDEPTANMDTASYQKTIELLQRLKAEGVTLMIATHAPESFHIASDHRFCLEEGKLVQQSIPDYSDAIVPLSIAQGINPQKINTLPKRYAK